MLIDAIDIYLVRHPLKSPWRTAYGSDSYILSVMVQIHSGSLSAWAESSPLAMPTYSPEYAQGVYYLNTEIFAPLVVGQDIDDASQFEILFGQFKGNPFAKSVIEMAWWALEAERRGIPLHRLLGGSDEPVSVGADFGIQDSLDELVRLVGTAVDGGYPRVKLKVSRGWDLEVVKTIRSNFQNLKFHIDCNSGYTLEDIKLFQKMDAYDLAMIEQPLNHTDIRDHAFLQNNIDTPICLDESCNSVRAAHEALELGACRFMNIKPGRVGGIRNALLVHNVCRDAQVGCWIGGMLESSVGVGMLVELATLDNITYPNDIMPSFKFFNEEISEKEIALHSPGLVLPSTIAGTEYKPIPERLHRRTISHKRVESA